MHRTPPAQLAALLRAPVAVLGAGRSGRAACALVEACGGSAVLYDEKAGAGEVFTEQAAARHKLVVFSPGFAAEHPWLARANAAGAELWTELDFAAAFWAGPVWCVTGTNGKTTLTEFLVFALGRLGKSARATGNIGYPFAQLILDEPAPGAIAVCEVSSFQAEMLRSFRSDATVWTNLDEDHLERHPGMRGYFLAKHRLVELTAPGRCWFGTSVGAWAAKLGVDLSKAGPVVDTSAPCPDTRALDSLFGRQPQLENYHLARALWTGLGLPVEVLAEAAAVFPRARHRIARCGEVRGVACYNDSKGTNFHAVFGALATFDRPPHWIGGGKDKGGDLAGFAERLGPRVASATLIGETGPRLAAHLRRTPGLAVAEAPTLRDAILTALARARPGDVLLLSPGFSSFDMFRGYEDRGDQFERLVAELAQAEAPRAA